MNSDCWNVADGQVVEKTGGRWQWLRFVAQPSRLCVRQAQPRRLCYETEYWARTMTTWYLKQG